MPTSFYCLLPNKLFLLINSIFKHIKTYKSNASLTEMELVALLSSGKGTWGQVAGLISRGEWEKIILVGSEFAEKFTSSKNTEFIRADLGKQIIELKTEILEKLKGKISGTEVALSIASGTGKEHMALISALLNLPVGIRFVVLTKDGIVYL